MKDKIIMWALILLLTGLAGCNEWLNDARPEDKFDRRELLRTETGIKSIWNGTYTDMIHDDAYGQSMTLTTIEILGQRFATSQNSASLDKYLASYSYNHTTTDAKFLAIWKQAYATVLGINMFISDLDKSTVISSTEKRNILLGEAYGLRAFVQFDMFRLFGPVYTENTRKTESIPYYRNVESTAQPFLPADSVLKLVLIDLNKSIDLLSNDPVITQGGRVPFSGEPLVDFYGKMRNRRFNYFAAMATKARVLMYMGGDSIQAAARVAREVITKASPLFPFASEVVAKKDKKFSSEVLFMLYNPGLAEINTETFSSSSTKKDRNVIAPTSLLPNFGLSELSDLSTSTDIRRVAYYYTPPTTTAYTAFDSYSTAKYDHVPEVTEGDPYLNSIQPLIRLSEMYYIVSEATGSTEYLNVVRKARLLSDLTELTPNEIKNEYFLDTAFEGQLFFFYKRLNYAQIPRGNNNAGLEPMTPAKYVIPLPVSETGKYD